MTETSTAPVLEAVMTEEQRGTESPKKNAVIYFRDLDVLRFLAAFMVVAAHAYEARAGWYGLPSILTGSDPKTLSIKGFYIDRFFRNLGVGVDVFFLISGFLITYLLLAEKSGTGKISFKDFYIRRTLRIWPLYYALIVLAPFFLRWTDSVDHPNYLSTALFLNNFSTIPIHQWTYPFGHFWSICVEEHFYLVWPFIIAYVPVKKLPPVMAGILFFSILFRCYTFMTNGDPWFTLYLHSFSRMDVLIIGALGAYFYHQKPFVLNVPRYLRIVCYVILLGLLFLDPVADWNSLFLACFKKYFYTALFAFAICNYLFNPDAMFRFRKHKVFHYLGKTSYSMYMWGNVLLVLIIKLILWRFFIVNIYSYMLIVTGVTLLVSILSYEIIEKPFLKLKERFSAVKTKRQGLH